MRRFLHIMVVTAAILILLALPDCGSGRSPDINTRQSPA